MNWIKSRIASLVYSNRISVVPAFRRLSWPQRMFLKNFLIELEADCVLDVGANGGQYGTELRLIGYTGHIISFEPDPQSYEKLIGRSNKDPKWHALNIALGRIAGQAEFNIMAASMFNSFRKPITGETDKFSDSNKIVKTVQVETARLADILPDLRRRHRFNKVFLKMDTQGFDQEVFAGALEVHDEIFGFQSEIGIKRIYDGVAGWSDQINAYQQYGFDLAGIFAVNPWQREVVEVDCYFRPV